jgi:putative ABC transport system permease protein
MFWRLLWKLLRGSRGRLAVAILALVSGAMVISALLNLELDVERKLTQEFRMLGANLVISPAHDGQTQMHRRRFRPRL